MKYAFLFIIILISFILPANSQPQITQIDLPSGNAVQYDMIEIELGLQASYSNPYNPDEIAVSGSFINPSMDTIHIPAFIMQEYNFIAPDNLNPIGSPVWKIRFTPDVGGEWQYFFSITDSSGSSSTVTDTLDVQATNAKGFIRDIAGNHFVFDDGSPFITLGENMAWGVPQGQYAKFQVWMDSLHDNGANFIKIMMVPWSISLEWNNTGLGNYDARQDRARHLDWVLELAAQRNIKVQLAFLIHDELTTGFNNQWAFNPYNQANGGPCAAPQDFFINPTAKKLFKQRLRYTLARWMASPEIIAWEILSEADNVENYDQYEDDVSLWLQEMNVFLDGLDPYSRPLTAGFAKSGNDPDYWAHPLTDFTQLHLYDDYPDFGKAMYNWSREYMAKHDKAHIIGEASLSHYPDTCIAKDPEGIAFRNSLWTTMLSGSLGAAMTWWWDNYIHPQNLYSYFKGPSKLLEYTAGTDTTWHAIRPQLNTSQLDTLIIEPGFQQLFMKAPHNQFIVERGGLLSPSRRELGSVLYGLGAQVSPFRNPPTFEVDFQQPGWMMITTGNFVVESEIKVSIDGIPAFLQTPVPNQEYLVPIPQGVHSLKVENSSTDNGGCEIASYTFLPYLTQARSFALKGKNAFIGWIQHQDFTWDKWYTQTPPSQVQQAELILRTQVDTAWTVHWIDPWTGDVILSEQYEISGFDSLLLNIPDFGTDIAYAVFKDLPSSSQEKTAFEGKITVFPNPSIGPLSFNLELPYSGQSEIMVYDSSGRIVVKAFEGYLNAGKQSIPWVEAGRILTSGLYIVKATVPGGTLTTKIIRQ